jgi:hypothetical protein
MGKRELLLVAGFALIGVVIYHATMPASPEGGQGFGEWLARIRSHVQNEWKERRYERKAEIAVPATIKTLAVDVERATVTVVGEPRDTAAVELTGVVFGGDDTMAKALEEQITVALEPEGTTLRIKVSMPPRDQMNRRPHLQLTAHVPARLTAEVRTGGGELDVSGVAAVHLPKGMGRVRIAAVPGAVTGEIERGSVEIEEVGSVTLKIRRCEARLTKIAGALDLDARGGELRARGIGGPATLDAENIDGELEDVAGPVKLSGSGGQVRVHAARGPIDADTRRTTLLLSPGAAVPITASTENDTIEYTLPQAGITLEATSTDGDLRIPEGLLEVEHTDDGASVRGAIRGGGPRVSLRTTRGDIVVR